MPHKIPRHTEIMSTTSQKSPGPLAVTARFMPADSFAVRVRAGFLSRSARRLRVKQISAPSWGKTFLPVATLPPVQNAPKTKG
jgi:hypothetical protein